MGLKGRVDRVNKCHNFQLETNRFGKKDKNNSTSDSHSSNALLHLDASEAVIYKRILILARREAFIQIRSPSQDPKCRFNSYRNRVFVFVPRAAPCFLHHLTWHKSQVYVTLLLSTLSPGSSVIVVRQSAIKHLVTWPRHGSPSEVSRHTAHVNLQFMIMNEPLFIHVKGWGVV